MKKASTTEQTPGPADEAITRYIGQFPAATRVLLEEIRAIIRAAAPEATEKISYAMPTFYYLGNLVHFAGYAGHIGFYPGANGVAAFIDELGDYSTSKGTIQFPLDSPLPKDLITRIVAYRLQENRDLKAAKSRRTRG